MSLLHWRIQFLDQILGDMSMRALGRKTWRAILFAHFLAVPSFCVFAVEKTWPYYVPDEVTVPTVNDSTWIRNDIDAFILSKLEANGLKPAKEASRRTLIRRLYYDLLGLPPSVEQVEQFVDDDSKDAYERLVDLL